MNSAHVIKRYISLLILTCGYWIIAFFIYDIFRYVGIEEISNVQVQGSISTFNNLEIFAFVGLVTGFFYFIIEILLDNNWMKRKSVGFRIIIKTALYLIILTFDVEAGVNLLSSSYDHPYFYSPEELLTRGGVWAFILYFTICSLLFTVGKIVYEKFGPGMFWKILIGVYNPPRLENKVFLFLDLRSSTTIAEELGHIRYSNLIQECFYDLNEVVPRYAGQINQYVGDEAVITWKYKEGLKSEEWIDLYFEFADKLIKKQQIFKEKYGVQPVFKAGIHRGEVIAAEIGVVKKEIAYHGDVVNTSARIQGKCNELGEDLLISKAIYSSVNEKSDYLFESKGEYKLRGKGKNISIYGVRREE